VKSNDEIFDRRPISMAELEAVGVRPRGGKAPLERRVDLLERYRAVPNRMMVLYSSEDELLATYIRQNWAALDELSGDLCDLFPSLLQLSGGEDIYSYLKDLRYIPGVDEVRIEKLPMILLWSDSAAISISLSESADDFASLKGTIRGIFQYLHDIGRGITIADKHGIDTMLKAVLVKKGKSKSYSVVIDRSVKVTNYTADRGGVVVGEKAKTRDIETHSTATETAPQDLSELVDALNKLRLAMKAEGTTLDQDVATGKIGAAQQAAEKGDRDGALSAIASVGKSAGGWVLQVAEKIGVGVATAAIKDALKGAI
jgi:hypothetical protein